MRKFCLLLLIVVCASQMTAYAQVVLPNLGDKYSAYVEELEAGETAIDYQDFRFSFVESVQYKVPFEKIAEFDQLSRDLNQQLQAKAYAEAIATGKQLLSMDYTSLNTHKIMSMCYELNADSLNAGKHKAILFGLLSSIVKGRDGKSCATAWSIIQVREEYFILQMLGANLLKQSLVAEGVMCDKMDVKMQDGTEKAFYFDLTKVFEGYKTLGLNKR